MFHARSIRATIFDAADSEANRVVGNQIHMSGKAAHQICEEICLIQRIVDAREHAVFDVNDPAGDGLVSPGGAEDFRNGPAAIHGNDPGARRVVWCVERKSQMNRNLCGGQRINRRNDSDGGDRDVPPAEVSHFRVCDTLDRG